jgi:hypothetical protein
MDLAEDIKQVGKILWLTHHRFRIALSLSLSPTLYHCPGMVNLLNPK